MSENNIPGEIIKRDITRELPVQLTAEEIALRAKGVGEKAASLQKLKDDVAEKAKREREKVSTAQADLDRMMEMLRTGTELRIVPCHERFHAGTILTVRDDTNEIVGAPRPANQQERQIAMPNSSSNGSLIDAANKAQADEDKTQPEPEKQTGFDEDDEDDDESEDGDGDAEPDDDEGGDNAEPTDTPSSNGSAKPKKRRGRKNK